jgi:hypothetical protein
MTDFLSRLAGRSIGIERVAEPVIPAMLLPASPSATPGDSGDHGRAVAAYKTPAMSRIVRPESTPIRGDRSTSIPEDRSTPERTIANPPASIRSATQGRTDGPPPQGPERTLPSPAEREHAAPAPSEWEHTLSIIEPPRAAKAKNEAARNRFTAETEAPPTIQVTIGRVEVRAEFPSPRQMPAAAAAKRSALSLDDYLKQRSEGRR